MMSIDSETLQCFGGVEANSLKSILEKDDEIFNNVEMIRHSSYYDNELLSSLLIEEK
jgi:hypothetical protein